jgi:TolB-like protein
MGITQHRRALACSLSLVLAACGGAGLQLQDVTPAAVPALEAQRTQSPQDENVLTRLGVAYFRANRFPEARAILDSLVARDPANNTAAIYRGMTAESQGDFAVARSSYAQVATGATSRDVRNLARQRQALVGRRELEYQARTALAQEAQLSTAPPEPNTIAVMPFGYTGANQDVAPLSRGFAQLVVTDLAKSHQVRVLERERMQALLDEMRLGESGRTDSTTAARSGRLLRAARVVQGSLSDERGDILRVGASVVDVSTTGLTGHADAADQMSRLFDMEKSLVIQLFQSLGITLTPAERQSIDQRPTQSLQAFLAWSRGLEAEDRGDFVGAQQLYDQAGRIDPGFIAAGQASSRAADVQAASTSTVQSVEVTVAANVTTGGPGSEGLQGSLSNGTNSVTPPPTTGGTTGGASGGTSGGNTTTTNPTNPTDHVVPPSTTPPTGTITLILKRP